MAQVDKTTFESRYNNASTGLFKTNTTQDIGSNDLRDLITYVKDSGMFIEDNAYSSFVATASGTDTYAATLSPVISAYASTQRYFIKFTNANTGAATLNLNALGAKAIVKNGNTALVAGDISASQIYCLAYDGTNLQVIGKFSAPLIDDDTFATASATTAPSSESTKAYVDAQIAGVSDALQSATVTLSAAEILDLNATPKQIIAAPGANKVISVHRAFLIYTFVTSAYATNTTLRIVWNGVNVTPVGYNNLLAVTESRQYTSAGNTLAGAIDASNKALMVDVQTGNPTGGDSTIKIIVEYSIIDI